MLKCAFKPNRYNGFSIRTQEEAEFERSRLSPAKYQIFDRVMESKKVFGYNREMACAVFVSYVEIYNDICYDLLDDSNVRQSKVIRTDAKGMNYVEGATEVEVSSSEEVLAQHLKGKFSFLLSSNSVLPIPAQERRKIAATMLNSTSSRSHSIFNIRLVMAPMRRDGAFHPEEDESQVIVSQLSLVDLAGSERSKRTENKGERLIESGKINQSLSVLRMCFDQLRENQRRGTPISNVSYRDQKLTYLFKSYFEGHGKIRMIICLNPRPEDFEENVFVVTFAEKAQTVAVHEAIVPAPLLVDLANMNYSRRKVNLWYRQWDEELSELSSKMPKIPQMPPIRLNGPNDVDSITQLREYFTTARHWEISQISSAESYENEFKKDLLERLCTADLDRARLLELENENEELREYNSKANSDNSRLQREINSLRAKLGRYEGQFENERRREEHERRQREKYAEAIGNQRKVIKNVADFLEESSSPNVRALRKKFSTTKYEEERTETITEDSSDKGTRMVRGYGGAARGVVYNPASGISRQGNVGFANARHHRRSRSVGARVLNHEPMNRIPNGTVFQQQFPRNTKHTTKPEPRDFTKCTDYIVTNQDVDSKGALSTKCVKGEIIPTAGGGTSVMFRDIELLTQESP
ncbi:Kinesin-like protein [Aphelenchoides bicaudatus]|nr:Kinesin-like protein [Aphelenchoides bicaudatus]